MLLINLQIKLCSLLVTCVSNVQFDAENPNNCQDLAGVYFNLSHPVGQLFTLLWQTAATTSRPDKLVEMYVVSIRCCCWWWWWRRWRHRVVMTMKGHVTTKPISLVAAAASRRRQYRRWWWWWTGLSVSTSTTTEEAVVPASVNVNETLTVQRSSSHPAYVTHTHTHAHAHAHTHTHTHTPHSLFRVAQTLAVKSAITNKQTTWKRAQAEPASMPLKTKLN